MAGTVVLSDELKQLIRFFALQPVSLAKVLGTDPVTMTEWLADNQTYPDEATKAKIDNLLELEVRLDEMFQSHEGVLTWLRAANGYLGGRSPRSYLLNGRVNRVNSALDAIEAGVFV